MIVPWEEAVEHCRTLSQEQQSFGSEMMSLLAERWRMKTLAALAEKREPMRFSRLMEKIADVSQKSLTKTVRDLERDGFVTRVVFPEVPPRVEYTVTPLGVSLLEELYPLWLWTVNNMETFKRSRWEYDQRRSKRSSGNNGNHSRT